MVVIRTTEDLIRAMDSNPEWLEAVRVRVLTRELLELPRRFEELSAFVQRQAVGQEELRAVVQELSVAVQRILATLDGMLARQDEMAARQDEMAARQDRMLATLTEMLARQDRMEAQQDRAEARQERMEARQDRMEVIQSEMLATQKEMLATLRQHTDDLAPLKGAEVEKDLGKQVAWLLGAPPLLLERVKTVRGESWTRDTDWFNEAMVSARRNAGISREQYGRVRDTDFIAIARRSGAARDVYVAFEASSKINRRDVDRAILSRDALRAAFDDAESLAAVYGREISEEDRRYAESKGVSVFTRPAKRR